MAVQSFRRNRRIRVPEVRLIDENGDQAGVVSTKDALQRAQEAGLDLVEVAPALVEDLDEVPRSSRTSTR